MSIYCTSQCPIVKFLAWDDRDQVRAVNLYMCDAWVWHMGVVQEVTAADGDHRTGWTRLDRLVQSSFYLFGVRCYFGVRVNDDVSDNSVILTVGASSRALHMTLIGIIQPE